VVTRIARGEVWWGESPDEKGRPFLVVSRDAADAVMQRVLVAPVTRRVRGVPIELPLGDGEGLPHESVASCGAPDLRLEVWRSRYPC